MKILLTGATGYIGGRLAPRLLERGHSVRCMVRDPARLQGRGWVDKVEVVRGDPLDPATLPPALSGMDVAYYLIHSLGAGRGFHQRDLVAARAFGEAARAAGLPRMAYLGGLGDPASRLSPHLRSRQETAQALREAGVPLTEFRSAVVVGSGSLSFEMVRYLTERLPIMICPRWVYTRIQPIAIGNVLDYLVGALEVPESAGRVIEIGGADVLTYGDMMLCYGKVRGLRRWLIPVPVLTPRLSAYWVHLITPVPANIAQPLIEGLRNEVVVRDDTAQQLFPEIRLLDYETAVRVALEQLQAGQVETAWCDSLATSCGDRRPLVLTNWEGMVVERREQVVAAPAEAVYRTFASLGGERGWLTMNWAWRVRGAVDRLVGGVGLRRGRRSPTEVRVGDAVDFFRAEAVEPRRLLRLRAEMRLPGEAWLEFQAHPQADGSTLLRQVAYFAPRGLAGWLYWYGLYPLHRPIFGRMIRAVAREAERVG